MLFRSLAVLFQNDPLLLKLFYVHIGKGKKVSDDADNPFFGSGSLVKNTEQSQNPAIEQGMHEFPVDHALPDKVQK